MDFTFLKATGGVAFFRSDAEQAEWTQEEMNLNCTFPYVQGKVIERGMVILFQDPATNDWQAYEVRKCTIMPGDAYQQIVAEDIAISELTDCHIPEKNELNDIRASDALRQILQGTGWNVGTVYADPVSSGDLQRGSAWQAVTTIIGNWNVYIVPRVTVNSSGISGRYLDIVPSSGIDRGLRLSVNKNVTDPCVTYDDTDLYTALYGYGGTYTEGSGDSRVTLERNFSAVVWGKTSDHPAKPAGQRYLEYPEMTALYGRNGKPRFGYYQNTNIDDPEILLQKTWETLKGCCEPKISISGTVADLKRMGYADVPLRLHDMAIVELEPVGVLFYKQVIRLTVDLLDPTKNLPEIGDYIPNIIYINRETENFATGGGKGSGRGGGRSKVDLEMSEYKTTIADNGRQIDLNAQHINEHGDILQQAGMRIDPETGVLIYAEDNENMVGSRFHVQSDRITAEVTDRKNQDTILSSRITQTANAITLEVSERKSADTSLAGRISVESDRVSLVVEGTGANAHIKPAAIVASINNGSSTIKLSADHIDIDGVVNQLDTYHINVESLQTYNTAEFNGEVSFNEGATFNSTDVNGIVNLDAEYGAFEDLQVGQYEASWKSFMYRHVQLSTERAFLWGSTAGIMGSTTGRIAIEYNDRTIYYLGR